MNVPRHEDSEWQALPGICAAVMLLAIPVIVLAGWLGSVAWQMHREQTDPEKREETEQDGFIALFWIVAGSWAFFKILGSLA